MRKCSHNSFNQAVFKDIIGNIYLYKIDILILYLYCCFVVFFVFFLESFSVLLKCYFSIICTNHSNFLMNNIDKKTIVIAASHSHADVKKKKGNKLANDFRGFIP